jgi:uncharacterized protein
VAVHSLKSETAEREDFAPAPDRLVSGNPVGETRNAYTSPDGRKYFGEWSCSAGAWRVSYSEWEYCRILEGTARLIGDDGSVTEVGPGGNLVIESGFEGVWENLTPVRKLYVIDLGEEGEGGPD